MEPRRRARLGSEGAADAPRLSRRARRRRQRGGVGVGSVHSRPAAADRLEMRIKKLKDPRGIECLERLRKLANWTPRTKPTGGSGEIAKGRGVSYIKYELVRTYVGVVADVEVNRRTGKIRVERFYVA